MATFNFYVDKKVTMWERASFEIEADTCNTALLEALKRAKNEMYPDMTDYETLYDTAEDLLVKDNHGLATKELYSEDEMVWDNAKEDE